MKHCNTCGQDKDESEFYRRGDKLRASCKDCDKASSNQYRIDHRVWKREKDKEYKDRHRDKLNARQREKRATRTVEERNQARAYMQAYWLAHKEELSARNAVYQRANKAAVNATKRAWRRRNRAKQYTANKQWVENNIEHCRAYQRAWNRERRRAYPEYFQNQRRRRYLRETMTTASDITLEKWNKRVDEFGGCCAYCLRPLSPAEITADHMRPVAKGGLHMMDNLVPCCQSCNSRKNDKTLLEFLWGRSFIPRIEI